MTGKELKDFAAKISDDMIVSVRMRDYGEYEDSFQMKASLHIISTVRKEEEYDV